MLTRAANRRGAGYRSNFRVDLNELKTTAETYSELREIREMIRTK